MKGDEELLEAFSGIEGLLERITSNIAKVEGEIDEIRLLEFLLVLMWKMKLI